MTSKADHLEHKIRILEAVQSETAQMLEHARSQLRQARDTTPYSTPMTCSGCGTKIYCEYDFTEHFHVPNPTYLNLGDCKTAPARTWAS